MLLRLTAHLLHLGVKHALQVSILNQFVELNLGLHRETNRLLQLVRHLVIFVIFSLSLELRHG